MLKLEAIEPGLQVNGLVSGHIAKIVAVEKVGTDALQVFFTSDLGPSAQQLYRSNEAELSVAEAHLPWTFDAPSDEFKLALEAMRIKLGYLFDPMMAVHSSNVIPLPHQISAVYENMLPKQPLRYVLADDPGAGKTIMAGLLIKELVMRGDAKRILVVSPGSLVEQWQSELQEKFTLDFKIFSREAQEQSVSGNFFVDESFVVARVDQLARAEDIQEKLSQTEWDLVIIDEAHKLSAHWFGRELKRTQRYELGELLGRIGRHLLLMTATPHNGKDEDFQLWLQLLDPDRFYGVKGEDGSRIRVDESIMRRMVKEQLLKFDGTRLFPPRKADTVKYCLSPSEYELYMAVTTYVVEEMNRAERLTSKARNCVGFALTMLQRRLASSPEAIYQSLARRHERLLSRIDEIKAGRGTTTALPDLGDDFDEDDYTPEELERIANQVLDAQTAAKTLPELQKEVEVLSGLVARAKSIRDSGHDAKWDRLSELLQSPEMRDKDGHRRKLIIFTEHKDSLNYLEKRIQGVLGDPHGVTTIHGGTNREHRREVQEEFNNNPAVQVLIATDAAGEGVNLHRSCSLMVNYDMPWNPCRLEQRFGRIHRIGQTEMCHLWNLVSPDTREGQVFERLLEKVKEQEKVFHGQVFDILGAAFDEVSLKDMLLKAIREGQSDEAKNWMKVKVESALNTEHLKDIIRRNSLLDQTMTPDMVYRIKDEMEKAEARKLQPCFVRSFFLEGLRQMGGEARPRQKGRYEIPHVPPRIVSAAHEINARRPVATRYSAICFEKDLIRPEGLQPAEFLHAGHPLVASVTKLVLEDKAKYLKPGTVMVDPNDEGTEPSMLFLIDHSVVAGEKKTVLSRRLQFVRMGTDGTFTYAGWAPHLDLDVATPEALEIAKKVKLLPWLGGDIESKAQTYSTDRVVKPHYEEIKARQLDKLAKLHESIRAQLVKAIGFYQKKYVEFSAQAKANGPSTTAAANAEQMRRKAEELANRLREREKAIEDARNVISLPPIVQGGILVIPKGMLAARADGTSVGQVAADAEARKRIELAAMNAVIAAEKALGNTVIDVSAEKCGWDLTSRYPLKADGTQSHEDRHIEVKGRAKGATNVTMTRNEICYAINQKDKFILALVIVDGDKTEGPFYIRNIWENELNFGVANENYEIADLMTKAEEPKDTV